MKSSTNVTVPSVLTVSRMTLPLCVRYSCVTVCVEAKCVPRGATAFSSAASASIGSTSSTDMISPDGLVGIVMPLQIFNDLAI